MRFTLNGQTYAISFRRHFPIVREQRVRDPITGERYRVPVPSKYPNTLLRLLVVDSSKPYSEWEEIAYVDVGCHPDDPFSKESGRLAALKALSSKLSPAMRGAVWTTYQGRRPAVPTTATLWHLARKLTVQFRAANNDLTVVGPEVADLVDLVEAHDGRHRR